MLYLTQFNINFTLRTLTLKLLGINQSALNMRSYFCLSLRNDRPAVFMFSTFSVTQYVSIKAQYKLSH